MAERKPMFLSALGFSEEMATGDTATFGGLTLGGDIAMGTNEVTGLPATPSGDTAAASKAYVDSVAAGLDLKEAVRVATAAAMPANTAAGSGVGKTLTMDAVGILTIDGVNTVLGDRILVKDETAGADVDHGIYEVTTEGTGGVAAILTRADDFDGSPAGEVSNGSFAFVQEGTANASTGWALITADPITVDTTAIEFSQFQGLPQFSGGQGIDLTSGVFSVDLTADAGLQFTGGAPNGTLGVKIDDTPDTLDVDSDGLKVVGLPSLFKVNDVAVGAGVTAGNLDTLTDGSNADALHVHAAAVATEAEKIENDLTTTDALSNGDPVYWDGSNNQVAQADAGTDSKAWVVGVARAAIGAAASGPIVSHGEAAGVLSVATAGTPYYLAAGGGLSASIPGAGNRVIQVGFAINADDLWVKIHDFGKKAA